MKQETEGGDGNIITRMMDLDVVVSFILTISWVGHLPIRCIPNIISMLAHQPTSSILDIDLGLCIARNRLSLQTFLFSKYQNVNLIIYPPAL